MSDLRDARFKRALDAAPDAQLKPLARTREAVRQAARAAHEAPSWWRKLWRRERGRMPWDAALATLLVAGFIGLLWHGQEVPDARTDAQQLTLAKAPEPAPANVPEAAGQPASSEQFLQTAAPMVSKSESAGATARSNAREAERKRPAEATPAPAPTASKSIHAAAGEPMGADAETSLASPAPAPSVAAAPAAREEAGRARASHMDLPYAPPARSATVQAAAPAAAPTPAAPAASATPELPAQPAAGPAPQRKSAAEMRAQRTSWESWTELRIVAEKRAVVLPRQRAPQLSDHLSQLARMSHSDEPMTQPVRMTFELSRQGTLLGVLEVGDTQVRWLPVGELGPSRTARPEPALLQELRGVADAHLPR